MPNISLDQLPYTLDQLPTMQLVEITQSSMASFLECPRKFYFRYVMLLRRHDVVIALEVGSAVHSGLEAMFSPEPSEKPALVRAGEAIDAHFEKVYKDPSRLGGLDNKMEHGRAVAHALCRAYWIVHGDALSAYDVISVEQNIRSLPGADLNSPLGHRMAGQIDGVLRRKEDSIIFLLERKTRSSLRYFNPGSVMLNLQVLWYMTLCREHPEFMKNGWTPSGFFFDLMVKPQHRMNLNGFDDLVTRMTEAILNEPTKYLLMHPEEIPERFIAAARKNFTQIVERMDVLKPGNIVANFNACDQYSGCAYKPLCMNSADPNDPMTVFDNPALHLFSVAKPHEELERKGPAAHSSDGDGEYVEVDM
jgi:hypothetical protein